MSQITTPAQLKTACTYQFAQLMDTWAFAFARDAIAAAVRRAS
jgi:hypothetical protein